MTKKLRVGLVSFAHVHAPGLASTLGALPQVEFAGIYDEDEQRGTAAASTHRTNWHSSLDGLLKASDAIVIASTNVDHRRYTEAAAKARVHVLCEKPLATTIEAPRSWH
jgi:predicted dehydrogenase